MGLETQYVGSASCWVAATIPEETRGGGDLWPAGCPQEGILLPLLWSLVVDELIRGLNGNGCYILGYADDIAFFICGKLPNIISELLQETLHMVQQWCDRTQLSINPQKMIIVPSTRKRDFMYLKEPTVSGHTLQLTTEVKYLGLILDKRLTCNAKLKNVLNTA
jgi:hypothetical protein